VFTDDVLYSLCLHNVIVGGMWYDYYGTIEIVNEKGDGEKAKLVFHRCGMFSRGSYRKVTGEIYDKQGNLRYAHNCHCLRW